VVSEETGRISYAYKGQLVRGVTIEELRGFLTSVLVQPSRSRSVTEWWRQRKPGAGTTEESKENLAANHPEPKQTPAP
jgi:hypothetical protein